MKSYDFYKDLNQVKALLESQGLSSVANSLTDAVETSSTSTEVLMRVRHLLKNLQNDNHGIDSKLAKKIDGLVSYINKLLS